MDDQQFKQLLEALKDALSRMGLTDGLGDLADNVDDANKNLTKQERLYKATASAFDKLNKDIDKGRKKIVDLGPALKNLGEQIEDLDDDVEKLALEEKHKLLAEQYLTAQYKKAGQDMSKVFGASLAKGVFDSTKTLVKSLQSGGSGVQLAADLMSTALDLNQSVLTGTAKTGEALGQSMMAAGGKAAKWGGRLAVASTAVDYFSSALTAAIKEGVQLLATEADKTIKAFNTATSAGALFGRGMDDLLVGVPGDLVNILAERLARHRHAVAVQQPFGEERLHEHVDAASFVHVLGDIVPARLQVGNIGRPLEHFRHGKQVEIDAAFIRDGRQVKHGVC
jgi:hypothetical protein